MSFGLSFSTDFFKREGDDDLTPDDIEAHIGKSPTSVYQALLLKTHDEWDEIARKVFGLNSGDDLCVSTVIKKVVETDTCLDLSSPVTVYIDDEGDYSVDVYEE